MTVAAIRTDQEAAGYTPEAVIVPPQGGYVAKRCARRAHNDYDLEYEGRENDDPESLVERMNEGSEFETSIGNELIAIHKPVVVARRKRLLAIATDRRLRTTTRVRRLTEALIGEQMVIVPECDRTIASKRLRETLTTASIAARVPFIWNARLVADKAGSRISEPDFLVLDDEEAERADRPVYLAGDVKHHKVLEGTTKARPRLISSLEQPLLSQAIEATLGAGQLHVSDMLQLAHYHRHLEALGYHSERPRGAVIGKERNIVWDVLDHDAYLHDDGNGRKRRSPLDIYDHEFGRRLAIIARSIARNDDPGLEPLVSPEWKQECKECPWRSQCHDLLDATHHVTLVQGITPDRARAHYRAGVRDYHRLAGLHVPTAVLVDAKADAPTIIASARAAADHDAAASSVLAGIVKPGELPAVLAQLEVLGVHTVGDLAGLHDATARYAGTGVHRLVEKIDRARVLRVNRVHRARGVESVPLPTPTTMGLHFDVENDGDHVYLIGVYVVGRETGRNKSKVKLDYHSFAAWDGSEQGEARVFAEFWEFFQSWIVRARAMKWGLKAYHYGSHEHSVFVTLAKRHAGVEGVPTLDEVEELFASDTIVDLQKVLVAHLIWPTEDTSLKALAKQAGFSWRDQDPSGGNSIAWYRTARNEKNQARAEELQQRILEYNEDDVQATARLVDFINRIGAEARVPGKKLPAVEQLDLRFGPRTRRR